MLLQLSIENFAVIEQTKFEMNEGLNVISGETGAGKSLVVQGLLALLGRRVGRDVVRQGQEKAHIEGIFQYDYKTNLLLAGLLAEKQLNLQEGIVILRREIRRSGTNLCWVNSKAVPQTFLQEIGLLLADVHVQGEYTDLVKTEKQLHLLDSFGGLTPLRQKLSIAVKQLKLYEQEKHQFISDEENSIRYQELIEYQLDEINAANLQHGEEERLIEERDLLRHALVLQEMANQCCLLLKEGDMSVIDNLSESIRILEKSPDPEHYLRTQSEKLTEILLSLGDIAREIRLYGEARQPDPERLLEVEKRLELIVKLKGKYGGTIDEVLRTQRKISSERQAGKESQSRIQKVTDMIALSQNEVAVQAKRLSEKRQYHAERLTKEITLHLQQLGMQNVRFVIDLHRQTGEEGITFPDGLAYDYTENGIDKIEFLIATNPGVDPKPLSRVASGGEISRILLALKNTLQENTGVPVLVFDEIDTGVGAKAGIVVGQKLWKSSKHHQVICVTHLPQIAAFADQHHCVKKILVAGQSSAKVQSLGVKDRIMELALMLGGSTSPANLKSAQELHALAEKQKIN